MGRGPLIVIEGQNRMNKSHLASIIAKGLEHITETRNNVFKLPHRTGWADCMTNQYLEGTLDLDVKVAHHLFSAERWKTIHDVKNPAQYESTCHPTEIRCIRSRLFTCPRGGGFRLVQTIRQRVD